MDSPPPFADRYLFANYGRDGVIVDLETGNYFLVNEMALRVCEAMAGTNDVALAGRSVANDVGIDFDSARRIVGGVRSALDGAPVRGTPTGPYHFHPDGPDGYALWHDGVRVLEVRGSDRDVVVPEANRIAQHPLLELYVRALAPKIMFLRGIAAVHASACIAGGRVIAFAGPSGAGKTTTVRAFFRAGAHVLSEDLWILKAETDRPSIVIGSEARVHDWANRTAALIKAGAKTLPSHELATMTDGDARPVELLHFLDVGRRAGGDFKTRPLRGAEGLVALMANQFLGDSSRPGWRRYFELARWLTDALPLFEVTSPAGTECLDSAVRRYTSSWTS